MSDYLYDLCDGVIHNERVSIEDVAFTADIPFDDVLARIKENNLPLFHKRQYMLAADAYLFFLRQIQ